MHPPSNREARGSHPSAGTPLTCVEHMTFYLWFRVPQMNCPHEAHFYGRTAQGSPQLSPIGHMRPWPGTHAVKG